MDETLTQGAAVVKRKISTARDCRHPGYTQSPSMSAIACYRQQFLSPNAHESSTFRRSQRRTGGEHFAAPESPRVLARTVTGFQKVQRFRVAKGVHSIGTGGKKLADLTHESIVHQDWALAYDSLSFELRDR